MAPAHPRSGASWLRSSWLRPFNDLEAIDDWLGLLNPAWSLTTIRARIVAIDQEADDVLTFRLAPNRRWPGFQAGQHVAVQMELDGVRHHRTFSLSSAPGDRTLAITVKRQGRVTHAMHERLRVGGVLTLSPPSGSFVLPTLVPARLVFLAAGTGITPMMSMLRHLAARGHRNPVTLVFVGRDARQRLFASDLVSIAERLPQFRLHVHYTSAEGRPQAADVVRLVPDIGDTDTFLCGPPTFMDELRAHPALSGLGARLRTEHFGPVWPPPEPGNTGHRVQAARSGRTFAASGGPLLVDAEVAGMAPKHGCRVGVCQTCKVRKRLGTVVDLRTGQVSAEPDELIALCVSAACSDLVIDL